MHEPQQDIDSWRNLREKSLRPAKSYELHRSVALEPHQTKKTWRFGSDRLGPVKAIAFGAGPLLPVLEDSLERLTKPIPASARERSPIASDRPMQPHTIPKTKGIRSKRSPRSSSREVRIRVPTFL